MIMISNVCTDFKSPNSGEKYILYIDEEVDGRIKQGKLVTPKNNEVVPIINFIPRFVPDNNYADNFGKQWNYFKKTQLDSCSKTKLTENRFYSGTKWSPSEMFNQRILEAGCGAGRFTEILLKTGAKIYSFDYSTSVDACYQNVQNDELCLFQGDIYSIPFEENYFDKVFCYGVLQHTPDPKAAFMNLVKHVKSGGKISIDIYLKDWKIAAHKSKYLYRPITKRMNTDTLLKIIQWYIPKWIPIDTFFRKIPLLNGITVIIPCWNYIDWQLTHKQRVEWAILDTFDALAPKYDKPQTIKEISSWFMEANLENIDIQKGGNGIIANGTKK